MSGGRSSFDQRDEEVRESVRALFIALKGHMHEIVSHQWGIGGGPDLRAAEAALNARPVPERGAEFGRELSLRLAHGVEFWRNRQLAIAGRLDGGGLHRGSAGAVLADAGGVALPDRP